MRVSRATAKPRASVASSGWKLSAEATWRLEARGAGRMVSAPVRPSMRSSMRTAPFATEIDRSKSYGLLVFLKIRTFLRIPMTDFPNRNETTRRPKCLKGVESSSLCGASGPRTVQVLSSAAMVQSRLHQCVTNCRFPALTIQPKSSAAASPREARRQSPFLSARKRSGAPSAPGQKT